MRTITGSIAFVVACPSTAVIFRESKEEATLGYGLGLSPSNEPEVLIDTIPVYARSGRVFFRKAENGELNGAKCLVVPTRYKVAANATGCNVYKTDVKSIVVMDFSEAPYRFVAFHDTTTGRLKIVDLDSPDKGILDCYNTQTYDLTLCKISDEEMTALPIPSWNGQSYGFSADDFKTITADPTENVE